MVLLPGCIECGNCGCECGTLPYTMTVTFSGLQNETQTPNCSLVFSSCFGSGASAVALAPGGDSPGPLSSVLLIDGGCGYAIKGRVPPTLTISGGSGTNATFTPTLLQDELPLEGTTCGCPFWEIDAISVSGGSGYVDGVPLSITTAQGDTTISGAQAIVRTFRAAPQGISATADGGTGALLSVSISQNTGDDPPTWGVDGVTVIDGGSGYTNGESVVFSVVDERDRVVVSAVATITTSGGEPDEGDLDFFTNTSGGSGAIFSFNWVANGPDYDLEVTLTDGGSGYQVGEEFSWSIPAGRDAFSTYVVDSVDGGGTITAIALLGSVPFAASGGGGSIQSVVVTDGGQYYRDSGVPSSVEVTNAGHYYRESDTEPPCVANVVVLDFCDKDSPASIEAVIDDDPSSWSFGKIVNLVVTDGGSGYSAWGNHCTNLSSLNGVPFVLKAASPRKIAVVDLQSCFGGGACITIDAPLDYAGGTTPIPSVTIENSGSGYARLGREEPEFDEIIDNGTGGVFTPVLSDPAYDDCGLPTWSIASVTISGDGTGYSDGVLLGINITDAESHPFPDAARVRLYTRQEPTVTATVAGDGSGASLSPVMDRSDSPPYTWRVSSVVVNSGGAGYQGGSLVEFSVPSRANQFGHYEERRASAYVVTGENGGIMSVVMQDGGTYWLADGIPQDTVVEYGGSYYKENPLLEPYVANVTATVYQLPPGSGAGAAVSVTVGSDPSQPATFGRIIDATVTSDGDGYLIYGGSKSCRWEGGCGNSSWTFFSFEPDVTFELLGNGKPPRVTLSAAIPFGPNVYAVFQGDEPQGNCDTLPESASVFYGSASGSVAIDRGGEWDSRGVEGCDIECQNEFP